MLLPIEQLGSMAAADQAGKAGKDEGAIARGKLPADLQTIVDREDDFMDELYEGRQVERKRAAIPQLTGTTDYHLLLIPTFDMPRTRAG